MSPSLCEICGRVYCDHTAQERGLTPEQMETAMTRELTPEELAAFNSRDPQGKIEAGRQAAREIFGEDHPLPPPARSRP